MIETIQYAFGRTSIADLLVARSEQGLVAIIIRERLNKRAMLSELTKRFKDASLVLNEMALKKDVAAIVGFVEKPRKDLDLPLDIRGTDFQLPVFRAVLAIPFGKMSTFTEIARQAGRPAAVRAVGTACTRNPLEFAIPCHRVLRSDGMWAGGSAWGDWRQSVIVGRERSA